MQKIIIPNYGKVTTYQYLGKALNKYCCRWIKTMCGKHFYCGTMNVVAPTMDIAIEKASAIRGYKPCLIQRI